MAYSPFKKPTNKIIVASFETLTCQEGFARTATIYPGYVISPYSYAGTDDIGVIASNGLKPPVGFCGYEQSFLSRPNAPSDYYSNRPDTVDEAFVSGAVLPIPFGGNFAIVGSLARGFKAERGNLLVSWEDGKVVPAYQSADGIAIKIPLVKKTSEYDTSIDFPVGIRVRGAFARVITNVAGAVVDAGFYSSEGGDADGLLDGLSLASAGYAMPEAAGASASAITVGALVIAATVNADSKHFVIPKYHVISDYTSFSYTTSNHNITGFLYVVVDGEGIEFVGKAEETVDATLEDKDIMLTSTI